MRICAETGDASATPLKFEYAARRFLNLTEIDDPDPISHVDDALTALQAHGDALPSDDESSYDSSSYSDEESYSSSEDEESLAESSLASAPPVVPPRKSIEQVGCRR